MVKIDIETLIKSIVSKIQESSYPEKDAVVNELKYSYKEYLKSLNDDYRFEQIIDEHKEFLAKRVFIDDFTRYDKYIQLNKEYFCFLISIYEVFILPLVYEYEISELTNGEEFMQNIVFGSNLKLNKQHLVKTNDFEKIGNLLFPNIFSINDFKTNI